MKSPSLILAAAFAVCAFAPATALAGAITGASGPIKVNNATKTLAPGQKLVLKDGDRVDTGKSTATWTSDAGDAILLDAGSSVVANAATQERGADGKPFNIDFLFVEWGTASGRITRSTSIGAATGWMQSADGATVFLETPPRTAVSKAHYRSLEGISTITYHNFKVLLFENHSVVLTIDPADARKLGFRTGQQNKYDTEIVFSLSRDNKIVAKVPRATSGTIAPEEGNKTKIAVDLTSLKTGKVVVETRFGGREPKTAELGPGTSARIDNETGDIQVTFESVAFEILESAIMLTSEFSTIAQSNFADIK